MNDHMKFLGHMSLETLWRVHDALHHDWIEAGKGQLHYMDPRYWVHAPKADVLDQIEHFLDDDARRRWEREQIQCYSIARAIPDPDPDPNSITRPREVLMTGLDYETAKLMAGAARSCYVCGGY